MATKFGDGNQILALPAVPNKTLQTYSNTKHTRKLLQTNHHRVNDLFNEDTRTFFTAEELAQATNIRPNTLAPLLNRITDNLPNTWNQTLRLSRRVFEPGNWVLLENADRQLARHHLFQIITATDISATLAWARPDPFLPKDNLYWLIPNQLEDQPLAALSHARVQTMRTPAGRTAVLYLGEEETAPSPNQLTLQCTKRIPHPPHPIDWNFLETVTTWKNFNTMVRANLDGRALKSLYLLLHKKLWTSERKSRIWRPPPDPFSCPICPTEGEEDSAHIPVCPTTIMLIRTTLEDNSHHNLLISLQNSIRRSNVTRQTKVILEAFRCMWLRRCRILYDDPPSTPPSRQELRALAENIKVRYPP